ncbi:unnamed protein product [Amoebophrya sp. A25]|nr:unnamed protein product [Amoebophrya sp. A25]|eukprot:GSA25T00011209001.1
MTDAQIQTKFALSGDKSVLKLNIREWDDTSLCELQTALLAKKWTVSQLLLAAPEDDNKYQCLSLLNMLGDNWKAAKAIENIKAKQPKDIKDGLVKSVLPEHELNMRVESVKKQQEKCRDHVISKQFHKRIFRDLPPEAIDWAWELEEKAEELRRKQRVQKEMEEAAKLAKKYAEQNQAAETKNCESAR